MSRKKKKQKPNFRVQVIKMTKLVELPELRCKNGTIMREEGHTKTVNIEKRIIHNT